MYGTMYIDHWHSKGYFHSCHPSDTNILSYQSQSGVLIASVVRASWNLEKLLLYSSDNVLIHSGN